MIKVLYCILWCVFLKYSSAGELDSAVRSKAVDAIIQDPDSDGKLVLVRSPNMSKGGKKLEGVSMVGRHTAGQSQVFGKETEPDFDEVEINSRNIAEKIGRNAKNSGSGRLIIGLNELTFPDVDEILREEVEQHENDSKSWRNFNGVSELLFRRKQSKRAMRVARELLSVSKLVDQNMVRDVQVMPNVGVVILDINPETDKAMIEETVKGLWRKNSHIWLLEADNDVDFRQSIPNDTYFTEQWALNQDQSTRHDVRAVEAWNLLSRLSADSLSPVIIAHIDSGLDMTHPEFMQNIYVNEGEIPNNGIDDDGNGYIDDVSGWNFADNSPNVIDYSSHGTHTAGTVAADRDNEYAMSGIVDGKVKLLPLAFKNLASEAINAIEYSIVMNAKISTNSWGFNTEIRSLRLAIEKAHENDQLFVCAVDNRGKNNAYFSDYPPNWGQMGSDAGLGNILRVANHNENGYISSTSNYGSTSVDISAPGENIVSTIPLRLGATLSYKSGTSMATPHVAAVAAVISSINKNLSAIEIRKLLMETATKKSQLQNRLISNGSLNFEAAVRAAIDSLPTNTTTSVPTNTTTSVPTNTTTSVPTNTTTSDPNDTNSSSTSTDAPSSTTTSTTSAPTATTTKNPLWAPSYSSWFSEFEYFPKYFSWGNSQTPNKSAEETDDKKSRRKTKKDSDDRNDFVETVAEGGVEEEFLYS